MNYYDNIAKGYNELHSEEQIKKINIILNNIKIKESDLILDVGCGTGILYDYINCKYIGIDPSIELLKVANKGFFINGKGEKLPFNSDTFDFVISITAIQNFDDLIKGIKEMIRVAKKDIIISVLKKSNKVQIIENLLKDHAKIIERIEEEKDIIYFLRK